MDAMVSLVVKVLWKLISLICFRVYLEVNVYKNPTCFSRWSVSNTKKQVTGIEEENPITVTVNETPSIVNEIEKTK